jgi:hypothetical protein
VKAIKDPSDEKSKSVASLNGPTGHSNRVPNVKPYEYLSKETLFLRS